MENVKCLAFGDSGHTDSIANFPFTVLAITLFTRSLPINVLSQLLADLQSWCDRVVSILQDNSSPGSCQSYCARCPSSSSDFREGPRGALRREMLDAKVERLVPVDSGQASSTFYRRVVISWRRSPLFFCPYFCFWNWCDQKLSTSSSRNDGCIARDNSGLERA